LRQEVEVAEGVQSIIKVRKKSFLITIDDVRGLLAM
jgi:hypothetical protein